MPRPVSPRPCPGPYPPSPSRARDPVELVADPDRTGTFVDDDLARTASLTRMVAAISVMRCPPASNICRAIRSVPAVIITEPRMTGPGRWRARRGSFPR